MSAVWRSSYRALSAVMPSPKPIFTAATASIAYTASTKPYVGIAKARPDSLTPRRFTPVSRSTKQIDSATA